MSETKHTKLPWERWNKDDQVIAGADGYVCRLGMPPQEILSAKDEANLEFIIRACNCHDELARVLNDTLDMIINSECWWMDCPDKGGLDAEAIANILAKVKELS